RQGGHSRRAGLPDWLPWKTVRRLRDSLHWAGDERRLGPRRRFVLSSRRANALGGGGATVRSPLRALGALRRREAQWRLRAGRRGRRWRSGRFGGGRVPGPPRWPAAARAAAAGVVAQSRLPDLSPRQGEEFCRFGR